MTVIFRCGHRQQEERSVSETPRCRQCGESRITGVQNATPVFKGACQGPLVKA